MKKSLLIAAVASLAFASCVKDDVQSVSNERKVRIGFDSPTVTTNVSTKANVYGEITGTYKYDNNETAEYKYPRDEDFVIYAVEHTGNFVSWEASKKVEFNGKAIEYDPYIDGWAPKYIDDNGQPSYYFWDITKKMSFAAYSPADLENNEITTSYDDEGLHIANFTMNTDLTKHYDLMYSDRIVDQTAENMIASASMYYGIPVEFHHALTSIHFSLLNETTAEVVLTGLELVNVKSVANFDQNIGGEGPKWTFPTPATRVTVYPFVVEQDADPDNRPNGAVFPNYSPQYVSQIVANGNATNSDGTSHYLLAIPQELGLESDEAPVTLRINYSVNGSPLQRDVVLSKYATYSDADNNVVEWEAGNRYTYRIVYSAGSALKDIISFSPSTSTWNDVHAIVVNL